MQGLVVTDVRAYYCAQVQDHEAGAAHHEGWCVCSREPAIQIRITVLHCGVL